MTTMYCDGVNAQGYGGYNAHPGITPYIWQVPFNEALTTPPRCELHDRPYLTAGGYALSKVVARFRETGEITAECEVYYGGEQASGCPPHGWCGSASETRDHQCPHQRIAAWIVRRHRSEGTDSEESATALREALGETER